MGKRITELFFSAVGMIFIISAAVIFTLAFRPLYKWDVKNLQIAETYGYTEQEVLDSYQELIDYNLSPFHEKLEFKTFPMSEEAKIHFMEVKRIFQGFMVTGVICGLLSLFYFLQRSRKKDLAYLKTTGILSLVLPVILGGAVALNWETFFIVFHEMMFDNDYWLFDPITDPIINCLPDTFFFHCAVMILIIVIGCSIGCIAAGCRFKGEEK